RIPNIRTHITEMENRLLLLCLLVGTTTASHITSVCRISKPWQMLPNVNNCQRFYVCTGDEEVPYQEFSCPAEYHFSKKMLICVPGSCSDESLFCGLTNKVQRIETDCSQYRQCLDEGAYAVAKCSTGNYFDPGRKACLPVAITAAHQCSCVLPENATLSNPNDCETYFRCHSGQAVLVQCPSGDYFNEKLASCIPDYTGICLEKPTMPPGLTEEALAMDECIRTGSRMAPHSRDCQRYYVCTKNRVLELRCPRGQYFDVVHRYCSLDLKSECQEPQKEEHEPQAEEQKKDVPEVDIPVKKNVETEGHKPVQKKIEKEVVYHKESPETEQADVKQPQTPLDAVSSYDKFSSKFISF
ncbi:peritrophin-48, partial [Drosophila eugracilis]|uniref:peritrophin-48 n=1 Tax=Drosophila eugracilis TaxID=29029 RepID=UPI001BD9F561